MARYGMTIPLAGIPLHQHERVFKSMIDWGYTDFWSSESDGTDGFTPLALAAAWTPSARLGIAIIPAYTRGPGVMAMTVAAMAEAAPGRFVMGLGTSSDIIVERWNDIPFERPYYKTRDMLRFLRKALAGERVEEQYDTFNVRGFRLSRGAPQPPPKILVAALRSGMLRLAGKEGDGAILNWLSAEDVKTVAPYVHEGGPDKEIVARIFVMPTTDKEQAYAGARRACAAYLNVPVYAAFHDWLGRRELLVADVGGMARGRSQEGARADPRRGDRRPHPVGQPGSVPREDPALRRRRRAHAGARADASGRRRHPRHHPPPVAKRVPANGVTIRSALELGPRSAESLSRCRGSGRARYRSYERVCLLARSTSLPSIMTCTTRVRISSGSPSVTTRLAILPGSIVPSRSPRPRIAAGARVIAASPSSHEQPERHRLPRFVGQRERRGCAEGRDRDLDAGRAQIARQRVRTVVGLVLVERQHLRRPEDDRDPLLGEQGGHPPRFLAADQHHAQRLLGGELHRVADLALAIRAHQERQAPLGDVRPDRRAADRRRAATIRRRAAPTRSDAPTRASRAAPRGDRRTPSWPPRTVDRRSAPWRDRSVESSTPARSRPRRSRARSPSPGWSSPRARIAEARPGMP